MKNYNGILNTVKNTYKHEGIMGFYKGLKAGLCSTPIFYSIYFPVYESGKVYYSKLLYNKENVQNIKVLSLAAISALFVSDLITTPLWVVRIRYQTQYMHNKNNKEVVKESFNLFKEINKIYRLEGFFALYRGYKVSLIGSPHIIIQFNIYEGLNKLAMEMSKSSATPYIYIMGSSIISKGKIYINKIVAASLVVSYPLEVIRNGLQSSRDYKEKNLGIINIAKHIHSERGIRGFYFGFPLCLARVMPNNTIMFCTYEFVSRYLASQLV